MSMILLKKYAILHMFLAVLKVLQQTSVLPFRFNLVKKNDLCVIRIFYPHDYDVTRDKI